jgi:hypothetical protein
MSAKQNQSKGTEQLFLIFINQSEQRLVRLTVADKTFEDSTLLAGVPQRR